MSDRYDHARSAVEPDELVVIRRALEDAEGVDPRRIDIELREGSIALRGWVSNEEQATVAVSAAQASIEDALPVVDELQVDANLREGIVDTQETEPTIPAEGEVLVGSTDMLAGTHVTTQEDMARAIEESEPWEPPMVKPPEPEPHVRGGRVIDDSPTLRADLADEQPSAPDVTPSEIAAGSMPSEVPEPASPPGRANAEKVSADDFGRTPDGTDDPMVEQVPGTAQGPGAVGEHVTGGGSAGSRPALETGAKGVDTEDADPARWAGGESHGPATHRGPQSRDDEALREDFPDAGH